MGTRGRRRHIGKPGQWALIAACWFQSRPHGRAVEAFGALSYNGFLHEWVTVCTAAHSQIPSEVRHTAIAVLHTNASSLGRKFRSQKKFDVRGLEVQWLLVIRLLLRRCSFCRLLTSATSRPKLSPDTRTARMKPYCFDSEVATQVAAPTLPALPGYLGSPQWSRKQTRRLRPGPVLRELDRSHRIEES